MMTEEFAINMMEQIQILKKKRPLNTNTLKSLNIIIIIISGENTSTIHRSL